MNGGFTPCQNKAIFTAGTCSLHIIEPADDDGGKDKTIENRNSDMKTLSRLILVSSCLDCDMFFLKSEPKATHTHNEKSWTLCKHI